MVKNDKLFPETSSIVLTPNHFKWIDMLLAHKTILQRDLGKETGLDKKTVSQIKSDFISLGWCKDVNLGSGREVSVELCKINEIEAFVGCWKFLKHSCLVRPHSIKIKGRFFEKPVYFLRAVEKLSHNPDYRLIISDMMNNKQFTLITEYGKIIFHLKGNIITFWVDGFILPITNEDLDLFEDYIIQGIQERTLKMHSLFKEHFDRFRIEILDCLTLKSLHLGVITKKNVSKIIRFREVIKELKMFSDNSIYSCDEIEAKGKLDSVLNRVKFILNELFKKEDKYD